MKYKRLTGWDGENPYVRECFERPSDDGAGCEDMGTSKCNLCEDNLEIVRRLAQYEDSGLSPEQVQGYSRNNGGKTALDGTYINIEAYDELQAKFDKLNDFEQTQCAKLLEKNGQLKQWVNDLQSGMYVNCVYCGHRYGPTDEVPASMADVLKQHIEQCPEHPMSKLKLENEQLKARIIELEDMLPDYHPGD